MAVLGLIRLTRPQNCLAASGFVFLGAFLNDISPSIQVLIASVVVTSILAGCNIYNDCADIEIDRINKPYRPLPRGVVSKQTADYTAYGLIAFGVITSLLLKFPFSVVALICSGLGILYSLHFKNTVLVGNIVVSALSAITILYGGLLEENAIEILIISVIIFIFMLAREILKLIEDYEGDRGKKVKTLATIYGQRAALRLSLMFFAAYMIASIIPFWTLSLSIWYLIITIGAINLNLMVICAQLWRSLTPKTVRVALRMTKGDFYIWSLALLVGKIFGH